MNNVEILHINGMSVNLAYSKQYMKDIRLDI